MSNETRDIWGAVFAAGGALLLGAVALIVAVVLDLASVLAAVLLLVAVVGGAWYGWRLARSFRAFGGRSRG